MTLLKTVFIGSAEERQSIKDLSMACSRLMIYASHFMKFHSLANPRSIFNDIKCKAILVLLNSPTRMAAAAEFQDSMLEYRALVDKPYENISYFHQLAAYLGSQLSSQYLTNIQEHFVQKIKGYCSAMIITRLKDQLPPLITRYLSFFINILTFL